MSLRFTGFVVAVFAIVGSGACVINVPAYGPTRPEAQNSLRSRAAFDLHCTEQQIQIVYLSGVCEDANYRSCMYGASCGDARIAYLYYGNNSWVANSSSTKSDK
jgi:hypothetical protein